ncbi:unnamed protein product, partial [Ectocarpus sp. 6 AP-2014]
HEPGLPKRVRESLPWENGRLGRLLPQAGTRQAKASGISRGSYPVGGHFQPQRIGSAPDGIRPATSPVLLARFGREGLEQRDVLDRRMEPEGHKPDVFDT